MADLSDDQLQQLCAALGWQGGTFWQVLETVKHLAAQSSTPVAWAVFAPNGNIRMWSTNHAQMLQFATDEGVALHPLYTNAPVAGVMASQPAQPLTALQIEDMVAEIMGDSWADFVADTGCFPDDFKLEPGRRLSFTPGAWAHMVGRFVAERLSPVFWCEQTQTWLYKDELRKAFKNRPLDPQPPAPVSGVSVPRGETFSHPDTDGGPQGCSEGDTR